jgi:hypothetical protein
MTTNCICGHKSYGSDHICGLGELTAKGKELQHKMKEIQENLLSGKAAHDVKERNALLNAPDQKNPLVGDCGYGHLDTIRQLTEFNENLQGLIRRLEKSNQKLGEENHRLGGKGVGWNKNIETHKKL